VTWTAINVTLFGKESENNASKAWAMLEELAMSPAIIE